MAIEIPEVDVSSGLDLCDGNMTIYLNALRLFASGTPEDLEKMKSVSKETLEDYSVAAHSVKSMSRYVGAEKARETAKKLEAMADAGDFSGVMAHNETFIKYALGIVDNVKNWLEKNDSAGGAAGA